MNVEIGAKAAQFPEKEYINGIFVVVQAVPSTQWKEEEEVRTVNLERFIEDQAYSPSPSPPFHVSNLDRRHTGRLRKRDNLLTGE
jgi:hypothetical protein